MTKKNNFILNFNWNKIKYYMFKAYFTIFLFFLV